MVQWAFWVRILYLSYNKTVFVALVDIMKGVVTKIIKEKKYAIC